VFESAHLIAYIVCPKCTPRTFIGPPGVGWWIITQTTW